MHMTQEMNNLKKKKGFWVKYKPGLSSQMPLHHMIMMILRACFINLRCGYESLRERHRSMVTSMKDCDILPYHVHRLASSLYRACVRTYVHTHPSTISSSNIYKYINILIST